MVAASKERSFQEVTATKRIEMGLTATVENCLVGNERCRVGFRSRQRESERLGQRRQY